MGELWHSPTQADRWEGQSKDGLAIYRHGYQTGQQDTGTLRGTPDTRGVSQSSLLQRPKLSSQADFEINPSLGSKRSQIWFPYHLQIAIHTGLVNI